MQSPDVYDRCWWESLGAGPHIHPALDSGPSCQGPLTSTHPPGRDSGVRAGANCEGGRGGPLVVSPCPTHVTIGVPNLCDRRAGLSVRLTKGTS